MAGINRLGKGPAKPGSFRPPDPNKYRTTDHFSEGTEGDADYQRMVQDIEDAQQSQVGWLFGRGAFDKGDLLYLRDEEEKKRFQEQELRDNERMQFTSMRTKLDSGGAPNTLMPPPRPPKKPPGPLSLAKLVPKVVVKPAVAASAGAAPAAAQAAAPHAKRQRLEDPAATPAVRESTGVSTTERLTATSKPEHDAKEDEDGGLPGLLGDYGSDSESGEDDTRQQPIGSSKPASMQHKPAAKKPP